MNHNRGPDKSDQTSSGSPSPPPAQQRPFAQADSTRPPSISIPKGGGAIRGLGEKFSANPVTGTGSISVPIPASPGRSGFGPQLSLSYDSGAGNGPFGFGWHISLASITRKTDKGLPRYQDAQDSDVFLLSGAEDLVPILIKQGGHWVPEPVPDRTIDTGTYQIKRYRPRVEGLFARIERWSNTTDPDDVHWRSITQENVLTIYGKDANSRIYDPDDHRKIFKWLISEARDDKGNAVVYKYAEENIQNVDMARINERNRKREANRYLKRVQYCNKDPLLDTSGRRPAYIAQQVLENTTWLFELILDYDEDHYEEIALIPALTESEQHRFILASTAPSKPWAVRPDSFSSYRAGFEIRTHRRCQRILLYHHIPDLPTGEKGYDGLVRSLDLNYADLDYSQGVSLKDELAHQGSSQFASFLRSITQSGYRLDETRPVITRNGVDFSTYLRESMPALEFEYSKPIIQDEVQTLDPGSGDNLPIGLDGQLYQWIDLEGEGISGILSEQAEAWFYKSNLGSGRFGSLQQVACMPSLSTARGGLTFLDLAGDGQLDLVELGKPTPGFYERNEFECWENFRPFKSLPNLPWDDPNLRFLDLTGDGHADILITEGDAITWYLSKAETGFEEGERLSKVIDEEKGPRLVFADGTQSIYLADFSGDGLTDIARITNGEVCYWPNIGYGRFGAKVTMDAAPNFDLPDQFSQLRIRLADIDGSGTTDIIYLGQDEVRIYFNQSGNAWSNPYHLGGFPAIDSASVVIPVDLLGNGTASLVWSTPLPVNNKPLQYIDLMGGQKPHLLVKIINNLGSETHLEYAPSTRYYLADKAAGRPWITKIPFPVHVVDRVEVFDRVSRNRMVSRYAYHHGYFDGEEREFRGFGLVEQWDTEEYATLATSDVFPTGDNIDETSHVPPTLTKTWFHTGAFLGRNRISRYFAGLLSDDDEGEYFREPGLTTSSARDMLLEDTVLPAGLTAGEEREACRALKGSVLRKEVYALDASTKERFPYMVTEQNFTVHSLQERVGSHHAVFFAHSCEAIAYQYERDPADPRIQHTLTLEVDDFGNTLKEATINYGRRHPDLTLTAQDQHKQTQTLITFSEYQLTNAIDDFDSYRTPDSCETSTYELTGYTPTGPSGRFRSTDIVQPDPADPKGLKKLLIYDSVLNYEDQPTVNRQRRIIECQRLLYRPDDLGASLTNPLALLPLGTLESLAIPGETYRLAFSPGLITQVFQRNGQPLIATPGAQLGGHGPNQGGYVDLDGDGHWWIPDGRVFYSPNPSDTSVQEKAHAVSHFYQPRRYVDPFLKTTRVMHDSFDLLPLDTSDALNNRETVGERDSAGNVTKQCNDYRVLQPWQVMDPNRNRSQVAFDALGRVVGTAVLGKPEEVKGDSLAGFSPDLTHSQIATHILSPLVDPHTILGDATTRLVYDLFAYQRTKTLPHPQPVVVYVLTREIHATDLPVGQQSKIQHGFTYSDGFGREIQKKVQAEPGPLIDGGPDVNPRWVGSGWTVYNNKGKPIRKYEPFFSAGHSFEFAKMTGVSPILFYDPLSRVVATAHPNKTYEKVVFSPWKRTTWDGNDTVLEINPSNDAEVGDFFRRLPPAEYLPTWHTQRIGGGLGAEEQSAASKTVVHAATPSVVYFDVLGRQYISVDDNGVEGSYLTRKELDIEGNQRKVVDALGRIVMAYQYDLLGKVIYQMSMDAGVEWKLDDVTGKPILTWDDLDRAVKTSYDELRRPIWVHLIEGVQPEKPVERVVYGEGHGETLNHREKIFRHFDSAGVVTNEEFDFKGNLVRGSRRLVADYTSLPDWSTNVGLDPEMYTNITEYDALDRPVKRTLPDRTVIHVTYNEANLLETISANIRGEVSITGIVDDVDYDAKARRSSIQYGNGARAEYKYDPDTFLLVGLKTTRSNSFPPAERLIQDLSYTHDPSGNITHIKDAAQQTLFFNNQVVPSVSTYTYDAIYRLKTATGREHIGQHQAPQPNWDDGARINQAHPHDGQAMRNYSEEYFYDQAGNIIRITHQAANGNWTRDYSYNEVSLIEPGRRNNRLSTAVVGAVTEHYAYDLHGNISAMNHPMQIQWDFEDQMQQADLGGGGKVYCTYGADGNRIHKAHEHSGATVEERIYMGGYEIYRKRNGQTLQVKRETIHLQGEDQLIALIETTTHDQGTVVLQPQPLLRYQHNNHLGSAVLELDDQEQIISYEEYYPHGCTSFQSMSQVIQAAAKRYRSTGKERDEETGLYYHGSRYYAPWVGRWISADPAGLVDGVNLYAYAGNNPIMIHDPSGTQGEVTIYHRTTAEGAASMAKSGVKTDVSRPHVWAGKGFYAKGDPNIPSSSGASGDVIVSQKISTQKMTTISDESFIKMQQETPEGTRLRSLVRSQMRDQANQQFRTRGRMPSDADIDVRMRDYMDKQMNRLAPKADVVRWKNPDGTYTYVVRQQSALRGKPSPAGTMRGGRFVASGTTASAGAATGRSGVGRVIGRLGGAKGVTLRGVGVVGAFLGAASANREYQMARQGYIGRAGPAVLKDSGGEYTVEREFGWIWNDYYKHYISGTLKGFRVKIGYFEYIRQIKKRDQKYGYFNFWGQFVPGRVAPIRVYSSPEIL